MQALVDILDAKRTVVNVTSLDTVETVKEKISKKTGLQPCCQILHVLQNGTKIEWKDRSSTYFGDVIKKKAIIYLSCKKNNSTSSYYVNLVTETGRVLLVSPEGGNSTTINDLRKQLSFILDLSADSLFLRVVELSRQVNTPLKELFSTLEDYSVSSGSVLYVQIHPWSYNWFHGKITRDQAEEVMSSASDGQFLVKESTRFPGDYVLFVCDAGKIRHIIIRCLKNMMFTVNGQTGNTAFDAVDEMVKFYMNKAGLLIKGKLTEPVKRLQFSESTEGEGLTTDSSSVRPRLQTKASSEIRINVVLESKTFSLLTSSLNQVHSLKEQIEEKTGQPADCQVLRLDDKRLDMNDFLLSDYHITEDSTIYVQVTPWNEDWYVGNMTRTEIESQVQDMSIVPTDGMFLIRDSNSSPGNYCLCVWWKGKPETHLVEFKKNCFTVGNGPQCRTLCDLVEYYKKHRGSLKSRLTEPVKIDKEQKCLLPPAVMARGSKAKAAYRRALEHGKTCDVRVRIMIIGEDKAGKTSLKRSLKGERFNKHEASTLGVDMEAPLFHDGLKAWRTHQTDENITVFDQRSALLVVRQLSEPVGYSTRRSASYLAKEYPSRKGVSCSEAYCSGRPIVCSKLPLSSASNGAFNGIGPCGDLHTKVLKGVNRTDDYEEPRSPFLHDDVFSSDQFVSDTLPKNIACVVEDVITSDQCPTDELPQKVAHLVERMLRQDHTEEVCRPVIWDFSGQTLLHGMNPIFMSREAVYVLVSDLSKDLFGRDSKLPPQAATVKCRAESSFDHLVRWMDLVHSFQDNNSSASVTSTAQPPVVLVGTHADKVIGDPQKPLNAILDSFHGKAFSSHIVDTFFVDNTRAGQTEEDPHVQRLRQKIISVASALPHTNREIPLQWLRAEKVFHRLASEGFKYVTLEQFKAVAKRVCRFKVDEDSVELLHFLCDCGAVLYFNELTDESNNLVFLDPQWLVYLFCQIITVVSGKKEPMEIRECRQTLAKKGILSEELVSFACRESGVELSKESLLSIMEKASVVCCLEIQSGEVVYVVPSLLPAKPEDEILNLIDRCLTSPVYVTFNSGYIPYGLFSRFVVSFSHWASHEHSARPPSMSANTARFFIGKKNGCNLTFAFFKSVIMVHLLQEDKQDGTEIAAVCHQVYRCIEEILDSLHQRCPWLHSMTWQMCARCDLCVGENEGIDGCPWHHVSSCLHPDCAHFIPLSSDVLRCDQTLRPKTRLDEDKLKPWLKPFRGSHFPDDPLPYKPHRVSHNDLLNLAHDVASQWKTLCPILLGSKELEHIDHDETTLLDKCITMLTRWRQSQASDATYAVLGMALMRADLEDLCEKYCLEPQVLLESSV